MSVCTFIAADVALSEVINPHYKTLSINEALAFGMNLPETVLSSGIDRNEPDVILWSDDEAGGDCADDFYLLKRDYMLHYCSKPFSVEIQWDCYNEERAKEIIRYIDNVLQKADSVEIWNVWLHDYAPPEIVTTTVNIKDLQPIHIKQMTEYMPYRHDDAPIYHCLRITR